MPTTRARNIWLVISLVTIVGYVIAFGSTFARQAIWTGFAIAAFVVILRTISRHHLRARSAWLCVAGATLLAAVTNVLRDFSPATNDNTTAEILLGGLLYTSVLVLLIIAAFLFVSRRRQKVSNASTMLDSAIVLVAATMVYAQFLIYPFWFDTELLPGQAPGLVAVSIGSLLLLATTVRLWFSTAPSANRAARLLVPAFIIMSGVGTLGLSEFLPTSRPSPDVTTFLMYGGTLVFFALIGASALDPTATHRPAGDMDTALASRSRVLVLMALPLLLPAALLWLAEGRGREFTNGRPFAALTVTLVVLLSLRVNLILKSYREAV
ncbi:MAG: hypothetical protein HQ526_00710, partial [Actinobacteria bacterium]|nr:hypothetical protein [Actinomycetota bacterium]